MTLQEFLLAYLGSTLNEPNDRLAEILFKKSDDGATFTDELNDGVLDTLKAMDKDRASKLKGDGKTQFDNGYKKAQAEVATAWEKRIREKFGIESDETGDELVLAALEKASKPSKLDDEKVKTHPLFLKIEKESAAAIAAARKEGETALEQFKAQQQREQRLAAVKQEARRLHMARNPVLSADAGKAENQIQAFLRRLDEFDFEPVEGGTFLPMKEGKRLENAQFHPIDLPTLVNQLGDELFDFQVQQQKGNAGNANQNGGQGSGIKAPTSKAEYEEAYWKETDPAKRSEITKAYEQAQRPEKQPVT